MPLVLQLVLQWQSPSCCSGMIELCYTRQYSGQFIMEWQPIGTLTDINVIELIYSMMLTELVIHSHWLITIAVARQVA